MGRLGLGFFFAKTSILLTLLALAWHTRNHLFAGEHTACFCSEGAAAALWFLVWGVVWGQSACNSRQPQMLSQITRLESRRNRLLG